MKCLSDWYGGDGNCYECEDNCTNVNKITEDDICPKCEEQLIFNENKVIICPKCSKIGGDTSEYREMSSTYKNIIEKGLS